MKHPNNELVFNNLYGLEIISEIIPKIIEWDLFPVQGIGYYQKGDHFGHLELKIYIQENSGSGLIIWSVEEYKIHTDVKPLIYSYLSFLLNLLKAVKGRLNNSIVIEVTDGSFHPVDSWKWGFIYATVYAFIDCFDKEISNSIRPRPINRDLIKKLQNHSQK